MKNMTGTERVAQSETADREAPISPAERSGREEVQDNEISAVDLAVMLWRRRIWFIGIFLTVVLASFALSSGLRDVGLTTPTPSTNNVNYSTMIAVGSTAAAIPLEPVASVKAQIDHFHFPAVRESMGADLDLEVFVDSNIVRLTTAASAQDAPSVRALHEAIVTPILERHGQVYERASALQSRAAEGPRPVAEALRHPVTNTTVLTLAQAIEQRKAPASVSPPRSMNRFLVGGVIAGLFLGILGALAVEFISRVRDRLQKA